MTLPSDYLFRKLGGKLGKKLGEKRPRGLIVWRSSSMAWMNTTATIKSWSAYLQQLQKAPCIKLCVSSRAWKVFADAFQVGSSLAERGGCV